MKKGIKIVFEKPYVLWTVLIFMIYMVANILLSQFYHTLKYIPYYVSSIRWGEFVFSIVFSILIGLLIAINTVIVYIRHRERKTRKESALTCAATLGGFATGICSACIAGFFPFLFEMAGISISWTALPFNGIEVQAVIVTLLLVNLHMLRK